MKRLIFLLGGFCFLWHMQAQELRGAVTYKQPLNKVLVADGKCEVRNDVTPDKGASFVFLTLGVGYELTKKIELAAGYRHGLGITFSDREWDEDYNSNRWTLDAKYKGKYNDNNLRLSNRFRYQYSFVSDGESRNLLRNKIQLSGLVADQVKPYVAYEPFYSLSENGLTKHRLYLGSTFELFKYQLELYFINEFKTDDGDMRSSQMLGAVLHLN